MLVLKDYMLVLKDYLDNNHETEIDISAGGLEKIKTISIRVVSGDEIAQITYKNGSATTIDPMKPLRKEDFFDGEYTLYKDGDTGIPKEWQNRTDTYAWMRP